MRGYPAASKVGACLSVVLLSSCALVIPQKYVSADEVTLPRAMKDLTCGLKTLQNEESRLNMNTGGIVDQVEITLNLKASATGDSTLVVDAKPQIPAAVGTLGVNYTDKTEIVGSRDNSIKITLKNIATATLNDAGKEALKRTPLRFSPGPQVLAAEDEPCVDKKYSQQLLAHATKINSPTVK